MKDLFFWKTWRRDNRSLFQLFAVPVLITLGYTTYCIFTGIDNVIEWDVISKLDQLKSLIDEFSIGLVNVQIPIDNYVVFQFFQGSALQIDPLSAQIYLLILIFALNLIMAVLPSLSKFWFYGGMGGFIGFMVLFNLNQIALFGNQDSSALLIVLGLYLSAGYYFREFNPRMSILRRFLIFTLIAALIGIIFDQFSGVDRPFLYIAHYGIYAPLVLSILFILSVAHEVIYGFVYLVTRANTPESKHSLVHFLVISLGYLAYVAITYMHYTQQISWDLVYLNPFLLLGVSIVIGLWGLRKREALYADFFTFQPVGALFYLGFAMLSMGTIAYVFSVGNDPLIEVLEDAILYSQLGFGILFFLYVIINFSNMLVRNMRVSRVVYQSQGFPFFAFRIGGVIVVGFIFFQSGFFPYYQSIAGYYNNIGDLYLTERKLDLAREYYETASNYEFRNHRSNYAMATIGRMQNEKLDEAYYFGNSLLKNPTEYAYVNLANVFLRNDQYFEGLFEIREGLGEFPYSPQLLNNLGYFYSRTDILDSALYFFNLANNGMRKGRTPVANIYAALAKSGVYLPVDSLTTIYNTYDYAAARANQIALFNNFSALKGRARLMEADTLSNRVDFALLYNTGLNLAGSSDTSFFRKMREAAVRSGNSFYENRMDMLMAMHAFFNHRTEHAFEILENYSNRSMNNSEYLRMMGKLSLKIDYPEKALEYFSQLRDAGKAEDLLLYALSALESGDYGEAAGSFNQLEGSGNAEMVNMARACLDVIGLGEEPAWKNYPDEKLYLMFRYRPDLRYRYTPGSIIAAVRKAPLRHQTSLDYMKILVSQDSLEKAGEWYYDLKSKIQDDSHKERLEELAYLITIEGWDQREPLIASRKLELSHPLYLHDLLLDALERLDSGDTTNLDQDFRILGTWDPYFLPGVIHAADYFDRIKGNDYAAYQMLVEAFNDNPHAVRLAKKIVDLSVRMNMYQYAIDGLNSMKGLMDEDSYRDYRAEILALIEEKQQDAGPWD